MGMDAILHHLRDNRARHIEDLAAYLRIPSISSDPKRKQEMVACADHTARLLENAGLEDVRGHPTKGHPIVIGSWRKAAGRPTVLIYGHYDVQPVDPLALWSHPPFTPHIDNERIYARGAADDKGQILMHINAVAAILAVDGKLPVNVCFVIEGEEEFGSANLPMFLQHHAHELKADVALVSDSSMWAEGVPAVTTSLRGLLLMEMTLTGPNRDLHSGTYGGAVANPLEILARMLAAVKDDNSWITIPGFYDRVGVAADWGEAPYSVLERLWLRPTFEINGMWGGFMDAGAKTVLPAKAHAKISMRLVGEQEPDEMERLVRDYFDSILPKSVSMELIRVPGGGRGVAIPHDFPPLAAARQALEESFGNPAFLVGEGASIPVVADLERYLDLTTLLIGFALPDCRAHSPNENLHLPTFHTGAESLVRLLFKI